MARLGRAAISAAAEAWAMARLEFQAGRMEAAQVDTALAQQEARHQAGQRQATEQPMEAERLPDGSQQQQLRHQELGAGRQHLAVEGGHHTGEGHRMEGQPHTVEGRRMAAAGACTMDRGRQQRQRQHPEALQRIRQRQTHTRQQSRRLLPEATRRHLVRVEAARRGTKTEGGTTICEGAMHVELREQETCGSTRPIQEEHAMTCIAHGDQKHASTRDRGLG